MPTRTYELEVPLTYNNIGGLPTHTRLKMILVGSQ